MPTRKDNLRFWGHEYDWSDGGHSWTNGDEWWQRVLDGTLGKYQPENARVLEIGPGAGRFTDEILKRDPQHVTLVDLAPKCLELCKERFADQLDKLTFIQNDGAGVPTVPDESIDFVFSFDVFVHIEKPELSKYFEDFARVLAPGAVGVVHYATIERAQSEDIQEGWRADYRSTDMMELMDRLGMEVLEDFYHPQLSHTNTSLVMFRRPAGA